MPQTTVGVVVGQEVEVIALAVVEETHVVDDEEHLTLAADQQVVDLCTDKNNGNTWLIAPPTLCVIHVVVWLSTCS